MMTSLDEVYRERQYLVANLAAKHPSVMAVDAEDPDWPVVYIELPTGQISWHISLDDIRLFEGLPWNHDREVPVVWDGHTTEEKYRRLDEYTRTLINVMIEE